MYDVAIIGGGLASLTLALQLCRAKPGQNIIVFERSSLPAPRATHKVGEATVEIGAHYLSHTLGLRDNLESRQLRKFGLRLFIGAGFHDDLSRADELGVSQPFPAISYQLDRGLLENDLVDLVKEHGVVVRDSSSVTKVEIDAKSGHLLTVRRDGVSDRHRCRWVIDASARVGVLRRLLKLGESSDHKMCAAWCRIESDFSVDDWSTNDEWLARCRGESRRPSTNHLMGSGYWIWIIPLTGGKTSIGLVTDPEKHSLENYDTFEKLLDWSHKHQPLLARELKDREPLDFLKLKNLSRGCRQAWSSDKWAITGEAGFFADPFYSPGTDFIGLSNTLITDLITRDCSEVEHAIRTSVYENLYRSIFESTMTVYEEQYGGFGDTRLMVIKLTWDYAFYWSVLAWLFFRERLTDLPFLQANQDHIGRTRALNEEMQAAFRERAAQGRTDLGQGRFFDLIAVPILFDLEEALVTPPQDLQTEFASNCARLAELAPKLLDLLAGRNIGVCELLGDLERRLDATSPCS
jgi:flavin-dependent dehydrogenase